MTIGHWTLQIFAGAGHVTSQISTQLPASKSPGVTGSADKKWWVLLVPVLVRLPVGSTSDEFYRFQSVQTTGGWCSCEETPSVVASDQSCLILEPPPEAFPLVGLLGVLVPVMFLWSCQQPPFSGYQWSPCLDTGTSTRGLSTGVTVGGTGSGLYRLPVGAVPVKKPLQWLPVISPAWSWNLHQRPFHWWDCWGYRLRSVQTTGGCCSCEETPSVVASDQSCLILEPPPEAFPLVWLLGVPVPVMFLWSCQGPPPPPSLVVSSDQPCLILEPPPEAFPLVWLWGYRFQSCSDHRCGCSEGSPTRSRSDHWPLSPRAEFWTGTSPVQATGRVTSQPVMRDTGTSSVQTAGCGHRKPARATG